MIKETQKLWAAVLLNIIVTIVLIAVISIKGDNLKDEFRSSFWRSADAENKADNLIDFINKRYTYTNMCMNISVLYYEGIDSRIYVSSNGRIICHIGENKGTIEDLIKLNISKGEVK